MRRPLALAAFLVALAGCQSPQTTGDNTPLPTAPTLAVTADRQPTTLPATVTITATPNSGAAMEPPVRFELANGTLLGSDDTAPYQFLWVMQAGGTGVPASGDVWVFARAGELLGAVKLTVGTSGGGGGGGGCCRYCSTGKPCGDSCIARDKTCHQPPGCACWASAASSRYRVAFCPNTLLPALPATQLARLPLRQPRA